MWMRSGHFLSGAGVPWFSACPYTAAASTVWTLVIILRLGVPHVHVHVHVYTRIYCY